MAINYTSCSFTTLLLSNEIFALKVHMNVFFPGKQMLFQNKSTWLSDRLVDERCACVRLHEGVKSEDEGEKKTCFAHDVTL